MADNTHSETTFRGIVQQLWRYHGLSSMCWSQEGTSRKTAGDAVDLGPEAKEWASSPGPFFFTLPGGP